MSEARSLLELQNVSLTLAAAFHRPWTWRDFFVGVLRSPARGQAANRNLIHVARDISFTVRQGDRIGIVGVNGAGKTSLCRCIAGFYRQTSGEIRRKGAIRSVFDTAIAIRPELTGRENATLLAAFLFPGEADPGEIVAEALAFSELGEFLDIPFSQYSKGMQARLGLSMAALRPADLLILDEVFDGADQFFRDKIATRMLQVIRDSGGVLFVSHAPEQIRRICNRVIVLHQGVVLFDGAVDDGLEFYGRVNPSGGPGGPAKG